MLKEVTKLAKKNKDYLYFTFRVVVGLMFLQRGAQKLFGAFGGNQVELISLLGLAGTIEFFGGLLIAVGLFAQFAALFGIFDMVGAWTLVHIKQGLIPIMNGGELALMFLVSFLIILSHGTGIWSLEKPLGALFRRRRR